MIIQKNLLKLVICILGIYFIILCLSPNVLSQIGKNKMKYTDEKSIDEYLSRYGLTRKDVQEYQEYAIYEVIVKTWTKAHRQSYWLERWKLKRCKVVDNTFRFETMRR